jgi:hypothetical protein
VLGPISATHSHSKMRTPYRKLPFREEYAIRRKGVAPPPHHDAFPSPELTYTGNYHFSSILLLQQFADLTYVIHITRICQGHLENLQHFHFQLHFHFNFCFSFQPQFSSFQPQFSSFQLQFSSFQPQVLFDGFHILFPSHVI